MGFLHGCTYHFGNRFNRFAPLIEEKEEVVPRYHPMYYRFNRYIPRRRMW